MLTKCEECVYKIGITCTRHPPVLVVQTWGSSNMKPPSDISWRQPYVTESGQCGDGEKEE